VEPGSSAPAWKVPANIAELDEDAVRRHDVEAFDQLENRRLLAVMEIDRALNAYRTTRRVSDLTDGLLDARVRLTKGMPS
jgi:hypothetical protein